MRSWLVQATRALANLASANTNRTGVARYRLNKVVLALSRSWTEAAITHTTSPRVSVTMNLLRPLTFLPASWPRVGRPTVSAPLVLWESRIPAEGSPHVLERCAPGDARQP